MKRVYATELKPGNQFKLSENPFEVTRRVLETQILREKIQIVTQDGDHIHIPKTDLVWIGN